MKISNGNSPVDVNDVTRRSGNGMSGIMLFECLVYIAVFFVVMGLAFEVFYICWDNAKNFRRTTDEITATLTAGERWRADVREATGPLQTDDLNVGQILRIPHASGEIDYRFADGAVWRRNSASGDWAPALPKIKSSRMEADRRRDVTAWKWEVELSTHRKGTGIIPLFTFEAVPQPKDLR